jgi:hypothetical protein
MPAPATTHTCPGCDKPFKRAYDCNRHYKAVHVKEKAHACDHEGCGKSFGQKSKLAAHKNIHTGAKPHKCRVCWEPFACPSGRRHHEVYVCKMAPRNAGATASSPSGTSHTSPPADIAPPPVVDTTIMWPAFPPTPPPNPADIDPPPVVNTTTTAPASLPVDTPTESATVAYIHGWDFELGQPVDHFGQHIDLTDPKIHMF